MNLTDWIVSVSTAAIAIIMSIAAFFAQKWIQSVEDKLEELSKDFKAFSKQINSLEQAQNITAKSVSSQVSSAPRLPYETLDRIEEDVRLIKKVTQEKILPQLEQQSENLGRVIVIETQLKEHESKFLKMFAALKIIAARK